MNEYQEDKLQKLKGQLTPEQRRATGMQAVLDRTRSPAATTIDQIIKLAERIAEQNRRQADGGTINQNG